MGAQWVVAEGHCTLAKLDLTLAAVPAFGYVSNKGDPQNGEIPFGYLKKGTLPKHMPMNDRPSASHDSDFFIQPSLCGGSKLGTLFVSNVKGSTSCQSK